MSFWQQNKIFVIVCGTLFVLFVYLWPSLIGSWSAPLQSPVVVSPHRGVYAPALKELDDMKPEYEKIFHPKGRAKAVRIAIRDASEYNNVLLSNFKEMHRWMSFVPRFPFRIPALRKDKDNGKAKEKDDSNPARRYVSLAYTYARDGELFCDEYGKLEDRNDGIVFLASTRNIALPAPYFGVKDMEFPDRIQNAELAILQIALIHELGHLAIRCGVDEITSIEPREPYTWRVKNEEIAKAYPLDVRLKCDLPTLLRFIHALDGAHGRVHAVVPAAAPHTKPAPDKPPKPEPIPEAARPEDDEEPEEPEDPGDDAPEEPAATTPRDTGTTRLKIVLYGSPAIFPGGDKPGALKERLTIFRPAGKESHELAFIANAVVTNIKRRVAIRRDQSPDDKKSAAGGQKDRVYSVEIEADVEPLSTVRFDGKGKRTNTTVRQGDFVASRFLLARTMKVKAVEGEIETDADGFPTDVTPQHLDVELGVAALQFLEFKMPKITQKRRKAKKPPIQRGW